MPLYRAEYVRDGSLRHMTFAARNAALATLKFYEIFRSYILAIGGKDAKLL